MGSQKKFVQVTKEIIRSGNLVDLKTWLVESSFKEGYMTMDVMPCLTGLATYAMKHGRTDISFFILKQWTKWENSGRVNNKELNTLMIEAIQAIESSSDKEFTLGCVTDILELAQEKNLKLKLHKIVDVAIKHNFPEIMSCLISVELSTV